MKNNTIFKAVFVALAAITTIKTTAAEKAFQQCTIMRNFFDAGAIAALRETMDNIEARGDWYEDYSGRRGKIWTDAEIDTSNGNILQELDTAKATEVDGVLRRQKVQSIMSYPTVRSIVCGQVFPRMLKIVESWEEKKLPKTVFSQIFLQRCTTSEGMDWHQDPGEDYDPQAQYSLIIMLSRQDHPKEGWEGGEFKIKPGLPKDIYDEDDVATIMPCCNQGILFNNQLNSHSVTPVTSTTGTSKRDLLIVTLHTTQMPTLVEKTESQDY